MKALLYLMSNDVKWMEKEEELPFTPYLGFDFVGLAGEQPLRISGMSYDIPDQFFKIRLSWLSQDPLNSDEMLKMNVGWKVKS